MSMLDPAFQALGEVRGPDGRIITSKFLAGCSAVLPIVDKLGTGFYIVKTDINGNITRLKEACEKDPVKYEPDVLEIIREECNGLAPGTYASATSTTKGLLWLKRAMQFIMELVRLLTSDKKKEVSQAASEAYKAGLGKHHGMITGGAFTVALKLVPYREAFLEKLDCQDPEADLAKLCELMAPVLADIDKFMVEFGQDDPAKA